MKNLFLSITLLSFSHVLTAAPVLSFSVFPKRDRDLATSFQFDIINAINRPAYCSRLTVRLPVAEQGYCENPFNRDFPVVLNDVEIKANESRTVPAIGLGEIEALGQRLGSTSNIEYCTNAFAVDNSECQRECRPFFAAGSDGVCVPKTTFELKYSNWKSVGSVLGGTKQGVENILPKPDGTTYASWGDALLNFTKLDGKDLDDNDGLLLDLDSMRKIAEVGSTLYFRQTVTARIETEAKVFVVDNFVTVHCPTGGNKSFASGPFASSAGKNNGNAFSASSPTGFADGRTYTKSFDLPPLDLKKCIELGNPIRIYSAGLRNTWPSVPKLVYVTPLQFDLSMSTSPF